MLQVERERLALERRRAAAGILAAIGLVRNLRAAGPGAGAQICGNWSAKTGGLAWRSSPSWPGHAKILCIVARNYTQVFHRLLKRVQVVSISKMCIVCIVFQKVGFFTRKAL